MQAKDIQARVTELMRGALARAADPKEPLQPGDLLRLAATVRVLEALAPVGVWTDCFCLGRITCSLFNTLVLLCHLHLEFVGSRQVMRAVES